MEMPSDAETFLALFVQDGDGDGDGDDGNDGDDDEIIFRQKKKQHN